jgi:hypothetical protein
MSSSTTFLARLYTKMFRVIVLWKKAKVVVMTMTVTIPMMTK